MLALPRSLIGRRAFTTSSPRQIAKITLVGRLGADPELHTAENGVTMIKYVVGHSTRNKEGQDGPTSWFRVASFEEGSINYLKLLKKGSLVYVEGDATIRTFENREGQKQTALNIIQRYYTPFLDVRDYADEMLGKIQALGPKPHPEGEGMED